MKKAKKLFVCLLVLLMVTAFAACSKECNHADADKDHKCDSCGEVLTECADTDADHKCDVCGKELSQCADTDKDHKCDTCGEVLSECTDANNDHLCDTCARVVSISLSGADSVIDINTGAPQETHINMNIDLLQKNATLDIIMPVAGVGDMYLVASEVGTDPDTSWLYMMATIIGEGTVTEADGNIQVNFAWNVENMDEETGEMITTPMSMNVTVEEDDGVYTATVNYMDYIVIDVDSNVKMTGSGEITNEDGSQQTTVVELTLDLVNKIATLDITSPIENVGNMYILASEAGTDPATSWVYMMATIVGKGTVTEVEGGYKVDFAWSADNLNEETGETVSTPMTLEIAVSVNDGAYTATVNYLDYIVVDVAA